jgi:hypothetical protein
MSTAGWFGFTLASYGVLAGGAYYLFWHRGEARFPHRVHHQFTNPTPFASY